MEQSFLEIVVFWVMGVISTLGYPGIFLLMTLESALIPIPSEITMPFSGFLASRGILSLWPVIFGWRIGTWRKVGLLILSSWAGFFKLFRSQDQEALCRMV